MDVTPEKYISICCDSQAALIALQVGKTTSPLVQQCRKALNDISTQHSVGLFQVPGHSRVCRNEIVNKLAKERTVHQFVDHELALQVSRQNMRKNMK